MLHITEEQVRQTLPVRDCIEVLRDALSREYINIPRYRLKSDNSLLHVMSASIPSLGVMGLKSYGTSKAGTSFAVLLFDEKSGILLSVVEANALGQIRTGSASGLATDLLARKDAKVGAVIGAGFQAETQLLAIDAVRDLQEIRVFSRDPEKRKAFIEKMRGRARAALQEGTSAEYCVRGADIVCSITSSSEPVVLGSWLKDGCHINAAGGNWASKRELDEAAIRKCGFICADSREQARLESGDLIPAVKDWNKLPELTDLLKGKPGRTAPEQITLFKSLGIAAEDVAAANYVYRSLSERRP